jgi:hypothetical protein
VAISDGSIHKHKDRQNAIVLAKVSKVNLSEDRGMKQNKTDYLQCPPLGRPPSIYLNGMSMILMMHPMTVMTSRHKLMQCSDEEKRSDRFRNEVMARDSSVQIV